jgi:hypothetical protein
MPIVKITGQGLMAISFLVALLWACVIGESAMVRRAQLDRVRVLRDYQRLHQQRSEPVVAPIRRLPARTVVSAG